MSGQTRHAAKLLRVVGGKPHASDDDHEHAKPTTRTRANAQLATPASSGSSTRTSGSGFKRPIRDDTDIYGDPISSEDEGLRLPTAPKSEPASTSPPDVKSEFKQHAQYDGPIEAKSSPADVKSEFRHARHDLPAEAKLSPKFKTHASLSPPLSAGSKRTVEHASSDSDDFAIFSSQLSHAKKSRTTYTQNIFVKPQATKRKAGYGGEAERQRLREERKKAAEIKRMKRVEEEKAKKDPGAGFKRAKVPDMFEFGDGAPAESGFKQPAGGADITLLDCGVGAADSSELSDAPSDMEDTAPGPRTTECAICSAQVLRSIREDFEDRFERSRQWGYKWQQRFCLYHRKVSALELWKEKGYPEIDWDTFAERLKQKRHMKHVEGVIGGKVESAFKKQLQERTKGGRNKTAQQLIDRQGETIAASAGYYGSRGEKVIGDHILTAFSDDLRALATQDRLLATSGVAGGVSGFLQAVLVPEFALSLVREDLGPKKAKNAMGVLTESAELGELLHPEMEDRVGVGEEGHHDGGGMEE